MGGMSEYQEKLVVRLTFISDCLGTAAGDEDIYRNFVRKKMKEEAKKLDGVELTDEQLDEEAQYIDFESATRDGMTIFPRDAEGNPVLWAYQLKGFLKNACKTLKLVKGTVSSNVTYNRRDLNGLLFVYGPDRAITSPISLSGPMGELQRPLRAETPQGERIGLACSETVPAGSSVDFEIFYSQPDKAKYSMHDAILEWLEYGQDFGLLQWRNSGFGRFTFEVLEDFAA